MDEPTLQQETTLDEGGMSVVQARLIEARMQDEMAQMSEQGREGVGEGLGGGDGGEEEGEEGSGGGGGAVKGVAAVGGGEEEVSF